MSSCLSKNDDHKNLQHVEAERYAEFDTKTAAASVDAGDYHGDDGA